VADVVVNNCRLTIVTAMFGRDAYWAVSNIDDGEIAALRAGVRPRRSPSRTCGPVQAKDASAARAGKPSS
jgi:hypothetical protein